MTAPQTPFDTGNPLLARAPVRLETGTLDTPDGKLGALTLRSATTTMTAFLTAEDLRTWSDLLGQLADSLSGVTVVAASPVDIARLNQQIAALNRRGVRRSPLG